MAALVHLVGMIDGTDEIFNLGSYTLKIEEGETAGDAWQRYLEQSFEEDWGEDDWDLDPEEGTPFQHYCEFMNDKAWIVCLHDPEATVDIQNGMTVDALPFEAHRDWMTIQEALQVIDALLRDDTVRALLSKD